MTMSGTTIGSGAPTSTVGVELDALRPPSSPFFRAGVVLLVVVLALGAWFVPGMLQLRVQQDENASAGGLVPWGSQVDLIDVPLVVPLGGATITSVVPIDGARQVGAWVVPASDRATYEQAVDGWSLACGAPNSPAPECQLPADGEQASALLAAVRRRGAPLDAAHALPRRVAAGPGATVVTLWQVSQCDAAKNGEIVVRAATIAGTVTLPLPWGLFSCD